MTISWMAPEEVTIKVYQGACTTRENPANPVEPEVTGPAEDATQLDTFRGESGEETVTANADMCIIVEDGDGEVVTGYAVNTISMTGDVPGHTLGYNGVCQDGNRVAAPPTYARVVDFKIPTSESVQVTGFRVETSFAEVESVTVTPPSGKMAEGIPPGGSATAGDYGSPFSVWQMEVTGRPGYATYCPPTGTVAGGSPPEVPPIRVHLTYGCIA